MPQLALQNQIGVISFVQVSTILKAVGTTDQLRFSSRWSQSPVIPKRLAAADLRHFSRTFVGNRQWFLLYPVAWLHLDEDQYQQTGSGHLIIVLPHEIHTETDRMAPYKAIGRNTSRIL